MNPASGLFYTVAQVNSLGRYGNHRGSMIRARAILSAHAAGADRYECTDAAPGVAVKSAGPVDTQSVAWAQDYVSAFSVRVAA